MHHTRDGQYEFCSTPDSYFRVLDLISVAQYRLYIPTRLLLPQT